MLVNELPIAFINAGTIISASVALPCLGLVAVTLRFWTRISRKTGLGVDDWLILAALIFVIGMGIAQIHGVSQHAVGYPSREYETPLEQLSSLPPEQRLVELIYWITWLLMLPANGLIKLSSIFLYRRIFLVERYSAFGTASVAVAIVCALWTVAFFFATIFGCGAHVAHAWGSLAQIMSCNTNVWTLQINTVRKHGVTTIFLLAVCSLAAAVVRLIIQLQISNDGYAAHTNVNLTLSTNLYWCMVESGIALIASCLPILRVLVQSTSFSSAFSSLRSKIVKATSSSEESYQESEGGTDMGYELRKRSVFPIRVEHRVEVESESQKSLRGRSDRSLV
ncbi:hypothetical protein K491DRAFT_778331 [Lophiostoma macrostomum CBS 122681]|uniref:Rhodopsin domain-containing protein n=1 Tax=Lophiostoma macrostomum CBS 122681 TaxID=1314788 RepID=A0A6A6T9S8_9PLEO|nr:hypothetical protein K491DRAFT_778331 [Lophiostoma macrostomum CBS 122681]